MNLSSGRFVGNTTTRKNVDRAASTRCPTGPNEILDEGQYGFLVPTENAEQLADSIQSMLQDQTKRAEIVGRLPQGAAGLDIRVRSGEMGQLYSDQRGLVHKERLNPAVGREQNWREWFRRRLVFEGDAAFFFCGKVLQLLAPMLAKSS